MRSAKIKVTRQEAATSAATPTSIASSSEIAAGLAGKKYGCGDRARSGKQRHRQRKGRDVANALFDRLLCGFTFVPAADAEHHLGGDPKQQQAAGDTKCGQRNFEDIQEPVADESGADQDRAGNNAGAHRDAFAGYARHSGRHHQEGRRHGDRIDHHKQRQQARDCEIQ